MGGIHDTLILAVILQWLFFLHGTINHSHGRNLSLCALHVAIISPTLHNLFLHLKL